MPHPVSRALVLRWAVWVCALNASGLCLAQTPGLHWLPNEGQWEMPVRMRADWAGGVTWLEADGMNMWVAGEGYGELWDHHFEGATAPAGDLVSHGWRVTWEGSSLDAPHETLAEAGHRVNIYKGQDPARWAEGLVPQKLMFCWQLKWTGEWLAPNNATPPRSWQNSWAGATLLEWSSSNWDWEIHWRQLSLTEYQMSMDCMAMPSCLGGLCKRSN